ncbi:hypothetical protein JYU34_022286 [Plutella xylostella]|uniref:Uncharacterized protein n=1 Tax=Plutella xylostella TaxID=51655 RepID=A0ABQ7PQM0_PLUXY|nr:hypothetical protein JYU34_022286 [Plutella xylostella]
MFGGGNPTGQMFLTANKYTNRRVFASPAGTDGCCKFHTNLCACAEPRRGEGRFAHATFGANVTAGVAMATDDAMLFCV